jgi:hypothetical protein
MRDSLTRAARATLLTAADAMSHLATRVRRATYGRWPEPAPVRSGRQSAARPRPAQPAYLFHGTRATGTMYALCARHGHYVSMCAIGAPAILLDVCAMRALVVHEYHQHAFLGTPDDWRTLLARLARHGNCPICAGGHEDMHIEETAMRAELYMSQQSGISYIGQGEALYMLGPGVQLDQLVPFYPAMPSGHALN